MFVEPLVVFLVVGNQNLQNSSHLPTSQDRCTQAFGAHLAFVLKGKAAWLHEQCFARIIIERFAREKEYGMEHYFIVLYFVLCYNMH